MFTHMLKWGWLKVLNKLKWLRRDQFCISMERIFHLLLSMLCGRPKTNRFSAFLSHLSKIIFERWLFQQFQRICAKVLAEDRPRAERAESRTTARGRVSTYSTTRRGCCPGATWEQAHPDAFCLARDVFIQFSSLPLTLLLIGGWRFFYLSSLSPSSS